jgi:pilus assembly protein Flp/PilA
MNGGISAVVAQMRRCAEGERGATSIEYAMIASGISIAILTAVTSLGGNVQSTFYNKLISLF